MDDSKYDKNRNERADYRDALIDYVNNISISNIDNIRMQSSLLSSLSAQPDELSRDSSVNFPHSLNKWLERESV